MWPLRFKATGSHCEEEVHTFSYDKDMQLPESYLHAIFLSLYLSTCYNVPQVFDEIEKGNEGESGAEGGMRAKGKRKSLS